MKKIATILLVLSTCSLPVAAQNETDKITIPATENGQEETIDLPEGMTQSCDSLLSEWMAKKYLYPDTTCTDPNTNPTFTPEEYEARLRRLPVVMEMPYNAVVQKFIDQYCTRLRRSVSYMLGAGNFYIPIFEQALDAYGLPLELKYLPVIESALDPTAKSHAGAVGLWQFMLATGKRYGLTVNSLIDERQDPYKATWAAAQYLRDLYKIFGDWNLVIAAYNCGPNTINKAIHRAGGQKDYWKIYPYLPRETQGYVPAFIAANYVMNYYCEHNICPMRTRYPVTTDTIAIHKDLHLTQVAELTGLDKEAVKALNPQYRTDIIPGTSGTMTLCLPTDQLTTFIDLGDSVYNYRATELLTRRTAVSVEQTEAASTSRASRTTSKTRSKSSAYSSRSKSTRSSRKSRKTKKTVTTTVRSGDTLSDIARRNGTTVKKLRQLNGIKGDLINTGKKIRVK